MYTHTFTQIFTAIEIAGQMRVCVCVSEWKCDVSNTSRCGCEKETAKWAPRHIQRRWKKYKKNISAIQRVVLLCAEDAASKLCFESIAIVDLIHREHRFLATHAFNYAHTIFDSDSTSVIDRKCVVPSRNPNDSRKTFHRNVMLFFVW